MQRNLDLLNHFVFQNNENITIGKNDYIFISQLIEREDTIDSLKKLNILVGANNSGKSRVLRAIFAQNELMDLSLTNIFFKFFEDLDILISKSRIAAGQLGNTRSFISEIKTWPKNNFINFNRDLIIKIDKVIDQIENILKNTNVFRTNGEPAFPEQLAELLKNNVEFIKMIHKPTQYHKLYIPTLRGMRPLEKNDLYHTRTLQDYFYSINLKKEQSVFTGFTIYSELETKLLGEQSERDFVREYENFLSDNFFDHSQITLVPRKKEVRGKQNDVVYINLNNDKDNERPMYSLGDGLQTIISITYPLFLWAHEYKNKENDYLFACIEEPELYLHPSMQRKLVEVLMADKFVNVQYAITTHSNHFLDLVNNYKYQKQISFYSVNNVAGTKYVKQENNLSDSVYNLLGARPSSLLLANKTIWVEGISDRMYIRHALELYSETTDGKFIKNFSEYKDYAFVEYSGSNLEHYFKDDGEQYDLDINSLSNLKNVFLLVDNDGVNKKSKYKKKFERYNLAKQKLGNKFKITDGLEIENYLSPKVLKAIYPDNLAIQNLNSDKPYKQKKLSQFLFSKYNITANINVKETTKRFINKQKFAEVAIGKQEVWNDLSKDMQNLTILIAKFINS